LYYGAGLVPFERLDLQEDVGMVKASRDFQVFAKPAGPVCNLACGYCYYLQKERLWPEHTRFRMSDDILAEYIVQHIEACREPVIRFSWHGGEPTVLGLDYFRRIVALQRKHQPANQTVANGMQTNGTLLDDQWCRFLAEEKFAVGLSLDGPQQMHDMHRVTRDGKPTYEQTMRGYKLLRKYGVACDILCVVNAVNVQHPTGVYRFFKAIGAPYVSFLPLVEAEPGDEANVSERSVPAEQWGTFLCTIFDEWVGGDIGRVKVQIFEEAARTAFGQEHSLCIFRPVCGDIPVVEHNGGFFSCDHYVDDEHRLGNIRQTPLAELLESPAQRAFGQKKLDTLPQYCRQCEVRAMCNGGCPKNRFLLTDDGETGLNYLCAGYKRFFNHCRPWVQTVAAEWQRQQISAVQHANIGTNSKTGRNAPCPCGSGKKYKNCCMPR